MWEMHLYREQRCQHQFSHNGMPNHTMWQTLSSGKSSPPVQVPVPRPPQDLLFFRDAVSFSRSEWSVSRLSHPLSTVYGKNGWMKGLFYILFICWFSVCVTVQGYEYQTVPGQCCGNCVQTSCVVTLSDNSTHTLQVCIYVQFKSFNYFAYKNH